MTLTTTPQRHCSDFTQNQFYTSNRVKIGMRAIQFTQNVMRVETSNENNVPEKKTSKMSSKIFVLKWARSELDEKRLKTVIYMHYSLKTLLDVKKLFTERSACSKKSFAEDRLHGIFT